MCRNPFTKPLASFWELSRLEWFELREGRLVVTEPLGPIIDIHTHLAMAHLRPHRVDLERSTPHIRHYLPLDQPLDMNVYVNQNLSEDQVSEITRDLTTRGMGRGGMRVTHTIPNLEREMADLGIAHSVVLPVDLPLISDNAGIFLDHAARHDTLIGFGCAQAWSMFPGRALDRQQRMGARGIKLHPGNQLFRPDSPLAMRLYRRCAARKLPVLFHCGPAGIEPALPRRLSQVRHYEAAVRGNPDVDFVLGHSGALQMEEALQISLDNDNAWLDISCQGLPNLCRIVDEADPDRILFGSDWPFYHQAIPLAKVLVATEGRPELRRKVLWENAERLLGRAT